MGDSLNFTGLTGCDFRQWGRMVTHLDRGIRRRREARPGLVRVDAPDAGRVALKRGDLGPGFDVPNPDSVVTRTRQQPRTVGSVKADALDVCTVAG